jgi:hypothetical protein
MVKIVDIASKEKDVEIQEDIDYKYIIEHADFDDSDFNFSVNTSV